MSSGIELNSYDFGSQYSQLVTKDSIYQASFGFEVGHDYLALVGILEALVFRFKFFLIYIANGDVVCQTTRHMAYNN